MSVKEKQKIQERYANSKVKINKPVVKKEKEQKTNNNTENQRLRKTNSKIHLYKTTK